MTKSTKETAAATSLADLLAGFGPIALFLDFDGVLAEIAPTPDAVEVTPQVIALLQTLNSSLEGAVAVVTGRAMADVDRMLAPLLLPTAADHGNVRRTRDGHITLINGDAVDVIPGLADELRAHFAGDDRIIVEAKPSAVAVHYRSAPERGEECIEIVATAAAGRGGLSIVAGKMVIEARAAGADKGTAVLGYMQDPPFAGRTPIFIGDDLTDEDGFAVVQEMGGIGIKVGAGDTNASYRIGATSDVPGVLDALIRSQEAVR